MYYGGLWDDIIDQIEISLIPGNQLHVGNPIYLFIRFLMENTDIVVIRRSGGRRGREEEGYYLVLPSDQLYRINHKGRGMTEFHIHLIPEANNIVKISIYKMVERHDYRYTRLTWAFKAAYSAFIGSFRQHECAFGINWQEGDENHQFEIRATCQNLVDELNLLNIPEGILCDYNQIYNERYLQEAAVQLPDVAAADFPALQRAIAALPARDLGVVEQGHPLRVGRDEELVEPARDRFYDNFRSPVEAEDDDDLPEHAQPGVTSDEIYDFGFGPS
jgi:hypothetical protein